MPAGFIGLQVIISIRVLVTIQPGLELLVIRFNKNIGILGINVEPAIGVMLSQRPEHDIEAFVDNFLTRPGFIEHQHRDGAFRRISKHADRFIPQHYFSQSHRQTRIVKRQPRSDRIRAAAE